MEQGESIVFPINPPPEEYWIAANGLKFVKTKDGRHILHQLWTSSHGNADWRPVPLEEEA